MPAVRRAARPAGAHLPAEERQAALTPPPADDAERLASQSPAPVETASTNGAIALLRRSELEIAGRLVSASNTTLYCRLLEPGEAADDLAAPSAELTGSPSEDGVGVDVADEEWLVEDDASWADDDDEPRGRTGDTRSDSDDDVLDGPGCVYKPIAGERPLWDFPDGTLAAREVAAFEVSERTGWALVPPTILRDGPVGPGMCQLWVQQDETELVDIVPRGRTRRGWLHVVDAHGGAGDEVMLVHADDVQLRRTAVFDVVVNNADRKGGHLLPTADGLRVVDHGLTFHVEPKLRTVLWGWAGSRLRDDEVEVLERLRTELLGELGDCLRELLDEDEVRQTARRIERLLRTQTMPEPVNGWRGLPWPPF